MHYEQQQKKRTAQHGRECPLRKVKFPIKWSLPDAMVKYYRHTLRAFDLRLLLYQATSIYVRTYIIHVLTCFYKSGENILHHFFCSSLTKQQESWNIGGYPCFFEQQSYICFPNNHSHILLNLNVRDIYYTVTGVT